MNEILSTLTNNAAGLALLIGVIGGLVKFWQWINIKKNRERSRNFKRYHRLIKELVEPDNKSKIIMLDRQIAIVYELRNFPEYFLVTERILKGLKETWSTSDKQRILDEIDYTIEYINKRKFWRVFFKKLGLKTEQ